MQKRAIKAPVASKIKALHEVRLNLLLVASNSPELNPLYRSIQAADLHNRPWNPLP